MDHLSTPDTTPQTTSPAESHKNLQITTIDPNTNELKTVNFNLSKKKFLIKGTNPDSLQKNLQYQKFEKTQELIVIKDGKRSQYGPMEEANVYNNFKDNFMGELYGNSEIILDRHRIVHRKGNEDTDWEDEKLEDLEQNYETFNGNDM
jgi:hypothetical protein